MFNNNKNMKNSKLNKNNINIDIISEEYPSFSPSESISSNDFDLHNNKLKSYSESNTKANKETKFPKNITLNLSTAYQTFSRNNQTDGENDLTLGERLNNELDFSSSDFNQNNSKNFYNNIIPSKKPRLSLKDSRTKIKQLRDKLYPLPEEERIKEQENLLPVPLNKMNDEKYKILKMHNLKRKNLPEYKSCAKYEEFYKPFENSLDKKNEYFLLKKKKGVYSSCKSLILEINLKNKNNEKDFPLYRDQDIGIYEYWQVPLIESKIDEDNDSDEEQINLAKKVCNLDLSEGIQYIQKNGMDEIINRHLKEENKEENNF